MVLPTYNGSRRWKMLKDFFSVNPVLPAVYEMATCKLVE